MKIYIVNGCSSRKIYDGFFASGRCLKNLSYQDTSITVTERSVTGLQLLVGKNFFPFAADARLDAKFKSKDTVFVHFSGHGSERITN